MTVAGQPPASGLWGSVRRFLRANAFIVVGVTAMLVTTGIILGLSEAQQPGAPAPLSSHQLHNSGRGLLSLDATLAALFDTGKAPGAARVATASVDCGPPGTKLRAGMDVECGLNSAVGPANMIVAVESAGATRFAIVEIGTDLGLPNAAATRAVAACELGGKNLCASEGSASPTPAHAAYGGESPPPGTGGLLPCVGGPVERPREVVLACADGNSYVDHLSWVRWSGQLAVGHGTLEQNDCTPDCAAGKFYAYPATISFSDVQPTHYGLLFTRYRLVSSQPVRPTGRHSFSESLETSPLPDPAYQAP